MAIRKLLVANRGEIAARVFRTCDRLGIATVAVVAPDDRGALHARRAGEIRDVGGYLRSDDLVHAATASGADAVHPGYGFLAESPTFAEAVLAAGLVWVGPPPEAMRLAADKLEARQTAAAAGVPILPSGSAEEVGFPLIVKAAAGGGGRGMRVVRASGELDAALEAARREAKASFADERVYCERLVESARHVEVQVLADGCGVFTHLGERDCSVQRRHQKVLEESPAVGLDPNVRDALCSAAIALARAAGYVNAGTVEFLVADHAFWFIELNARLQVEHPVSELVTGIDLIEEQLRIAAGGRLELEPTFAGHAVEVRLYAEHPLTFLPQAGVVERLELPTGIRVDQGVEAGDSVPVAYDPLIAKLVAQGGTRDEALDRLSGALRKTEVAGVTTNVTFLRWLVRHPEVRAGRANTAFLAEHPPFSNRRATVPPWSGFWRLNRESGGAPPAPAPPPVLESGLHSLHGLHERTTLTAPMPGTVLRVLARDGQRVAPREPVVVLEAMKMETPIPSPHEAVIRRVLVAEGDQVAAGAPLVELEE